MPPLRKQISTNQEPVSCDVCGRSLLRGESPGIFIFGGARRNVCDLCTVRAAHEGWIREGVDDLDVAEESGRRGTLLSRLRARRTEQQQQLAPGGAAELIEGLSEPEPENPTGDVGPAETLGEEVPQQQTPAVKPPAAGRRQQSSIGERIYDERTVHGVPSNADLKVARALDLFNRSQHARTVAGVSRSLDAPVVNARPSVTEGSVVTIVVAWELSWYRFEVDLGDEAAGVRVVGQGYETSELEEYERVPNASAGADGRLSQTAAAN